MFNFSILNEYRKFIDRYNVEKIDKELMHRFVRGFSCYDSAGDYKSPISEFIEYERKVKSDTCTSDDIKNFEFLCNKYQLNDDISGIVYNYKNLSQNISRSERDRKRQEEKLISLMLDFVKDSISPIDKKKRKTNEIQF